MFSKAPFSLDILYSLGSTGKQGAFWVGSQEPCNPVPNCPQSVTLSNSFPIFESQYLQQQKKEENVTCSVVSNSLRSYGYSLPGSSVHGILQARILEWVAIPFSGDDQTWVSRIAGKFFTV